MQPARPAKPSSTLKVALLCASGLFTAVLAIFLLWGGAPWPFAVGLFVVTSADFALVLVMRRHSRATGQPATPTQH